MYYPDYLIHYNKNHSPKNGQFTSGDGDGDGISNDHAHRSEKKKIKGSREEKLQKPINKGTYAMSTKTWKNNAGINLRYVSPNSLKAGYWIDADTGKRASFGNQWRRVPDEFRVKEWGKSMFSLGVASLVAGTIRAGASYIDDLMK